MKNERRLLFGLFFLGLFLAASWAATSAWGLVDVQTSRGLTVAQLERRGPDDPQWSAHSQAWSPLPFIVVIDWGRSAPLLHGHSERTWFIWFFGMNTRISRQVRSIS